MFNSGVRGKRAKDGTGFLSTAEQFNQKNYLVPTVTSFSVTDVSYVPLDNTAVDTAGGETIVINGSGFAPGATVQVGATTIGSVTYVDQNRLAFSAPALSSGSYTIYVTNSNGGTGILVSGLVYSGLPTFSTSAGSLGTVYETANINTSVVATGDAPITYTLLSGTLPTGATLNSNGTITGNAPADGSSTTYSFTIQASDGQLQDSTRSFSLTINTDVLTWSLANNTIYPLDGGVAMSNVTLSATSTANSNSAVTFAANTLPTGVSLSGNTISGTPTAEETIYTALTATATQTGRTATRYVSWIVSLADAFFKYTTLAINSETSSNSTFVKDASTNNFAITTSGVNEPRPDNYNPYALGYYSNLFNGSTDYATIASNAGFGFGTGDFTVEFWFNAQGAGDHAQQHVFQTRDGTNNGLLFQYDRTNKNFSVQSDTGLTGLATANNAITEGVWYHIACTRSGTTVYFFVNGALIASTTSSQNINATTPFISRRYVSDGFLHYFNGYISNLRILKNVAAYTAAFTPSLTPLTAITGTQLLTCQNNRFIDGSVNNSAITLYGTPKISPFDPFVPNSSYSTYGSTYFDGSGDYLTVPASTSLAPLTGNYTYECWVYPTSSAVSYRAIFGIDNYGAGQPFRMYQYGTNFQFWYTGSNSINSDTISINTWYHLAVTRTSGVLKFFVNGTQVGSNVTSTVNYPSSIFRIGMDLAGSYPFVGYISDLRAVIGTAVYTTAFTPPTTPLTAISGTSLLTLQNSQPVNNNVFLDNSTNNFPITRYGNTTQGTFSPYGGNWSNYFDGTGDFLTVPTNAALDFGTGDFTVECWIYLRSLNVPDYVPIFANSYLFYVGKDGEVLVFNGSVNVATGTAGDVGINTWTHIAYSRSSSVLRIYVNGVQKASATVSASIGSASPNRIANYSTVHLNGYISNLRVVKGTALYTANFTPSTTPLTPIVNTSLLTCADNRLVDDSPNNFTITKNGDVTVQRFSPFNPSSVTPISYSGYFDGTGDYLTTTDIVLNSDFTIECWVNTSDISIEQAVIGRTGTTINCQMFRFNADGATNNIFVYCGAAIFGSTNNNGLAGLTSNSWIHLAMSRASGVCRLFVNGVLKETNNSFTSTIQFDRIGVGYNSTRPWLGYISNFRCVSGTALYTSNFTPSTTPLTAISGTNLLTCQSPTFIDNSTNKYSITTTGDARPSQQNPFGFTSALTNGYTANTVGGSAYFDGTGDYLLVSNNSAFDITGDFTIEAWVYFTAQAVANQDGNKVATISGYSDGTTANKGFELGVNFTGNEFAMASWGTGNRAVCSFTPGLNTWYHLAATKQGSTTRLFINGVSQSLTTNTLTINAAAAGSVLNVGRSSSSSGGALNYFHYVPGYIADFRIVKGTALYTSSFVPPVEPVTAVQNTVLLNNFTNAAIADYSTMNNLETVGDAKISTAVSKFGGSSMSFDGTGDYAVQATNINFGYGTGDFTIEFWLYLNTVSADQTIVSNLSSASSVNPHIYYFGNNGIRYYTNSADRITGSSLSINTWYHIAVCRSSGSTKMFINGTQSGSTYTDSNNYGTTAPLGIGTYWSAGSPVTSSTLNGYIDDLRITKGYARYTSTFTPPTTSFKTK